MSYQFQPLPYAYNALENVIDEKTMHLHKDKHHKTYFDKFTSAIAETSDNGKPLEEILKNISKYSTAIRNNGGGYYNHDLYFNSMRAPQENNQPQGALLKAIEESFESFENFKQQFANAGINQFGSGWAWLIIKNDKLVITSTANQDNPLMDSVQEQGYPLLGCDVWEHAYYLNYQNRRPDYIENWWKVINWDYITERYQNHK